MAFSGVLSGGVLSFRSRKHRSATKKDEDKDVLRAHNCMTENLSFGENSCMSKIK